MIEIQNLTLLKKDKQLLFPLSLSIQKGEIVCLAGRNGAGKTTFLRCLLGLEQDYKGKISIFDSMPKSEILKKIGVMIDGLSLYSYLTGKENLDIIRRYYQLPFEAISHTLELVGLQEAANQPTKQYSAGMKQRLAIGMAFIHKPELIILDEPLNALDPEAIIEIRQLIKRLNANFGTTFLITSHSLEEISKIFSRLLIFKNGKMLINAQREILDSYYQMQTYSLKNDIIFLLDLIKKKDIFYKKEEEKIEVLGTMEQLESLKKATNGAFSWESPKKSSVEEIYLFANFQ